MKVDLRVLVLRLVVAAAAAWAPASPFAFQRIAVEGPSWVQASWVGPGTPLNAVCFVGWLLSLLVASGAAAWAADAIDRIRKEDAP